MKQSTVKKVFLIALFPVAAIAIAAFSKDSSFFEVSKNLEVFVNLYKELNTYYVDTLNHDELLQAGAEELCTSLDPYTDLIPEENIAEYRQMTTGRYGGIGAIIGARGEYITVTEPYEGCPSVKAGIRAGDKILQIDGKSAKGLNSDEVSKRLKGKAGTNVNVKVLRLDGLGAEKEVDIVITREEIKIKNVPYYGLVSKDIGYIRLGGFTDKAGNEVHNALNSLLIKSKIKGLILDLRGNPGGLLNEAVNVANVFVDKGQEIVSTKGKIEEQNKSYYTSSDPTDTKIPLIVIADTNSASAAEIVTGTMQDLDRAVVIGQTTFGKGLVQSTHSLPYNAKLKLTTAKYYIPSGRCIQAINYAKRKDDGSVQKMPDSLKAAYKTKGGRTVYDGVGIEPDIRIEPERMEPVVIALYMKNMFFDYATEYRSKHASIPSAKNFTLTDAEYTDFMDYLKTKKFEYTTFSEKVADEFKTTAEKGKTLSQFQSELNDLKARLAEEKKNDLIKQKTQIKQILEEEIASRYYWQGGRIESSIRNNEEVKRALEMLSDENKMNAFLKKK